MSNPGKPRKILEPETGRTWRSAAALSREIGWTSPTITRRITDGQPIDCRFYVFADDVTSKRQPNLDEIVRKLRAENLYLRTQLAKIRSAQS